MVVKALVGSALLEEVWGNRIPRSDVGRNETASIVSVLEWGPRSFASWLWVCLKLFGAGQDVNLATHDFAHHGGLSVSDRQASLDSACRQAQQHCM